MQIISRTITIDVLPDYSDLHKPLDPANADCDLICNTLVESLLRFESELDRKLRDDVRGVRCRVRVQTPME